MTAPIAALASIAVILACAVPASALSHAGTDPPQNFPVPFPSLPSACSSQPTGTTCENAAVSFLNQARASLGQPAYLLPTHFTTMTPAQQAFVLTNLDRLLYGLPVVPGLTDSYNSRALTDGVQAEKDPTPPASPTYTAYTTNYANATGSWNMPLAYEFWMYDDGYRPGGGNVECQHAGDTGCWGHRHDILTIFDNRTLAMGAAAGSSTHFNLGFAMFIAGGTPGTFNPTYSYTWDQAVADGAGVAPVTPVDPGGPGDPGNPGDPGSSNSKVSIKKLKVHGKTIKVEIDIPSGVTAECALWRKGSPARKHHYAPCNGSETYKHVKPGHYVFSVTTDSSSDSKKIKVG